MYKNLPVFLASHLGETLVKQTLAYKLLQNRTARIIRDKEEVTMANIHDITRNEWMLKGPLAKRGYDWW